MEFFTNYIRIMNEAISFIDERSLFQAKQMLISLKENKNKVIIVGNGGSAAMASHVSVDFTKVAKIRTINFNEADLITCFANDYGYENWVSKALEAYGDSDDLLIAISSSGKSLNIINAVNTAKKMNIKTMTFSGFSETNPLRSLGDINFWVNSKGYNIIEMTHHIWLLALVDSINEKIEYSAN